MHQEFLFFFYLIGIFCLFFWRFFFLHLMKYCYRSSQDFYDGSDSWRVGRCIGCWEDEMMDDWEEEEWEDRASEISQIYPDISNDHSNQKSLNYEISIFSIFLEKKWWKGKDVPKWDSYASDRHKVGNLYWRDYFIFFWFFMKKCRKGCSRISSEYNSEKFSDRTKWCKDECFYVWVCRYPREWFYDEKLSLEKERNSFDDK